METTITLSLSLQISLLWVILSGLWLVIICPNEEEIKGWCCYGVSNLCVGFVAGLIDTVISHFFAGYTEMWVTMVGMTIVNLGLMIVVWSWRKESKKDVWF